MRVSATVTCIGQTYDRTAIEGFWKTGAHRDPLSNVDMPNLQLCPDLAMRRMVQQFLDKHPSYTPDGWLDRTLAPLGCQSEAVSFVSETVPQPVASAQQALQSNPHRWRQTDVVIMIILVLIFLACFILIIYIWSHTPAQSTDTTTSPPPPVSDTTTLEPPPSPPPFIPCSYDKCLEAQTEEACNEACAGTDQYCTWELNSCWLIDAAIYEMY